jgi:predicted Zn-dependent protease with MMP-like domain
VIISDQEFEAIVSDAIDAIPKPYDSHIQNVAFLIEDEPTPEQRLKLNLYPNETLYGLYEGVPLPRRGGTLKLLPDKITIFKNPIIATNPSLEAVKLQVGKTIWHEVAHYYGLDHAKIHELENKHIR